LEPLGVHVVTEHAGNISGIIGRRSGWPVDAVDGGPQRIEVALRVSVRQLDHDPVFSMVVELIKERGQVAHVVEDVVAHNHVRVRGCWGNVRPPADDLRMPYPVLLSLVCKHIEHGPALVDGDH
jgi:hypothetical protein